MQQCLDKHPNETSAKDHSRCIQLKIFRGHSSSATELCGGAAPLPGTGWTYSHLHHQGVKDNRYQYPRYMYFVVISMDKHLDWLQVCRAADSLHLVLEKSDLEDTSSNIHNTVYWGTRFAPPLPEPHETSAKDRTRYIISYRYFVVIHWWQQRLACLLCLDETGTLYKIHWLQR